MYQLRDYQQKAVNAIISHVSGSIAPCVAELATGAGKSLIVAEIARIIHKKSGGKSVLCIAPSAELVTQNREKYLATGEPASIFSASLGARCLRHPVVFGTPQTIKNGIEKFGDRFAMVIIDESHSITPTIKTIIDKMKSKNKMLRVVGLSATPYRLGNGYIYAINEKGIAQHESEAKEPYFINLVYKLQARELIERGYLTRPVIGEIGGDQYDTSNLHLNRMGKFDQNDIDKAFVGHGRKTAAIVADVVHKSRDRRGVMFFAATVQHADEVLASLPPELSAIVTGETPKTERKSILNRFKNQKIKYLVNVAVLTTGYDAAHVDVIAVLRATESAGLFQQIIGRGLRLFDGKNDCLVLDYAGNIDRHTPDGDLFNPKIEAKLSAGGTETGEFICPSCGLTNVFTLRKNKEGYRIDKEGYFTDLRNMRILTDKGEPYPAHYGRSCMGYDKMMNRCGYRWTSKVCEQCGADNDIAAKYCTKCRGELIDPNEKLEFEFKQMKKDPHQIQIDEVLATHEKPSVSKAGNPTLRVEIVTPYRVFTVWFQTDPKNEYALKQYQAYMYHKNFGIKTVEYVKEKSGFFKILSYNKEAN